MRVGRVVDSWAMNMELVEWATRKIKAMLMFGPGLSFWWGAHHMWTRPIRGRLKNGWIVIAYHNGLCFLQSMRPACDLIMSMLVALVVSDSDDKC